MVAGAISFGATPVACGAATTTNTDSIAIAGTAGTVETLTLDMSGGAFAPGATAEGGGVSEIEIATTLGDATDVVVIRGYVGGRHDPDRDERRESELDTDLDVTFAPLPAQIEVFGLGGANTLSAAGGSGTGAVFAGQGDPRGRRRRRRTDRAATAPTSSTAARATTTLQGGNGNDVAERCRRQRQR